MHESNQHEITRLSADTGILLMQHGAESTLAENVTQRVCRALGARGEVAITANALTLTTHIEGEGITLVRRILDRGINMGVTAEVQAAMLDLEAGELDRVGYAARLGRITPKHYPKWMLVPMIGASCASFAAIAHADWQSCALVFISSSAAMLLRLVMAGMHFRPLVSFFLGAFLATLLTGLGVKEGIGATAKPALAACVLLFVPGFPLINAVADMVKGHINVGISRGVMAALLVIATCSGIVLAASILDITPWL